MAAIGATAGARETRERARVLAAFAASLAVHALLLASAYDWRVAGAATGRPIVVTVRPGTGGGAAPSGTAGGAGGARAAAASPATAAPAPRDLPAPAPNAPARPSVAARPAVRRPTTMARAATQRSVDAAHRSNDAPQPRHETASPPPTRADGAVPPASAPASSTFLDGTAPPAGAPGGLAGGAGDGRGSGGGVGDAEGPGRGGGAGGGEGGDGLRALCASCPAPEYPARARRQGWQGTVDVALAIGADGSVTEARVRRSSGYPPLDEVALDVARRSRFTIPPSGDGVRGELRYRFVLDATAARR